MSKSPAKAQPPQARRQKDPYPDVEPGKVPRDDGIQLRGVSQQVPMPLTT